MTGWIKSLAAAACLLTIILHLVPENRFAKYVRFYAGLLFFLLAVQPVLELMGSADEWDKLLQLEFLKEEYYDLESAAEGLDDLKNEQIQNAYQKELERQAAGIASAYGLTPVSVEITFGEDGYSVEHVLVLVEALTTDQSGDAVLKTADNSGTTAVTSDDAQTISAAAEELAELYLIPKTDIEIVRQGE